MKPFLVSVFVLWAAIVSAVEMPTITCHCFSERDFEHESPAAVDPYLLATTQNSFFAAVFGVDKKKIVQAKMSGVSGEDLWVAYYVSKAKGVPVDDLLAKRRKEASWEKLLLSLGARDELYSALLESGKRQVTDEALADAIVDRYVVEKMSIEQASLRSVRTGGGGSKEVILSSFIAVKSGRKAIEVYREVSSGKASWGQLLLKCGINPSAVGDEVAKLFRQPKP